MKHILVGGGWGYGNLGDDAILFETLRLIRTEQPDARLTVLSYDPPGTRSALAQCEVEAGVAPSVHLYLMGDAAHGRYGYVKGKQGSRPFDNTFRRVNSRLQPRSQLLARKAARDPLFFTGSLDPFPEHFRSADVMVMAGGGYMNWMFMDGLVAHACEMILAKEEGACVMTAGQSVGPLRWNDRLYRPAAELAARAFASAGFVSVRDPESRRELSELGVEAQVVPDLALACIKEVSRQPEADVLTVVTRFSPRTACAELAERLRGVHLATGLTPRITVSRLWRSDISTARLLQEALTEAGVKSELAIPGTVGELESCLGDCCVVVSMNLHGLILAWRLGVPVVAIEPNRKIDAFIKQAGGSANALSMESALAGNELEEKVKQALDLGVDPGARLRIRQEVREGFSRGLQAALVAR